MAFVFFALDENNKPRPRLKVVLSMGGTATDVPTPGTASVPRWSPNGEALGFIGAGLGEGPQIGLWTPADGRIDALTSEQGVIRDFQWSPDGASIAFTRTDPEDPTVSERRRAGDDALVVGEGDRHTRLWLLDLKSRTTRLLTSRAATVWKFSFSPDGKRIVLLWSELPTAEGQEYRSELVMVDVADARVSVLASRVNAHATPALSPDGSTVAYLGPIGDFKERGTIHLLSLRTGQMTVRFADAPFTVWDVRWHPGGSLLAAAAMGTVNRILEVDATGAFRPLLEMNHSLTPYWSPVWSLSADGRKVAFISETTEHPEEVWVAGLDGSDRKRLSNTNPALAEIALGKVETVSWTTAGQTLEGVLVWPPSAPTGRALPLVTLYHGGPGYNCGLGVQIQQWAQLFAGRGYLVFLPNFRGSTGYGFPWMSANVRDWGEGPLRDVLSGIDHLVAKGWADPGRLLVGGRSYGGYLTGWTVTHTDRFRAAFDIAGLSELITAYGLTDEPSFFKGYFQNTPYQDPEIYRANSPLASADRARTPTLILHGEKDLRCPVSQAQIFHAALVHHGVDARLVIYPREGHGFSEYAHQIDAMRRVLDWFRNYDRSAQ